MIAFLNINGYQGDVKIQLTRWIAKGFDSTIKGLRYKKSDLTNLLYKICII